MALRFHRLAAVWAFMLLCNAATDSGECSARQQAALALKDVHVAGELCHCLRIFGLDPYTFAPLREGLAESCAVPGLRRAGLSMDRERDLSDPWDHAFLSCFVLTTLLTCVPCFDSAYPLSQVWEINKKPIRPPPGRRGSAETSKMNSSYWPWPLPPLLPHLIIVVRAFTL